MAKLKFNASSGDTQKVEKQLINEDAIAKKIELALSEKLNANVQALARNISSLNNDLIKKDKENKELIKKINIPPAKDWQLEEMVEGLQADLIVTNDVLSKRINDIVSKMSFNTDSAVVIEKHIIANDYDKEIADLKKCIEKQPKEVVRLVRVEKITKVQKVINVLLAIGVLMALIANAK